MYLLEPNIKRSRGGLRDLQLLRWIGFARYGEVNPEHLRRGRPLESEDYRSLRSAQDFFSSAKRTPFPRPVRCDVLYRSDQVRLAEIFGYPARMACLPVEQFMQEYFHQTSTVREVVAHFVDGARWRYPRPRRIAAFLTSHQVDRDFRVGPTNIVRNPTRSCQGHVQPCRHVATDGFDRPLQLPHRPPDLACHSPGDDVAATTCRSISGPRPISVVSVASQSTRTLLRRLHEIRVLEKLVPGFDHARCLLQFNEYHKYTVDEHSIRAVERATEFAHAGRRRPGLSRYQAQTSAAPGSAGP